MGGVTVVRRQGTDTSELPCKFLRDIGLGSVCLSSRGSRAVGGMHVARRECSGLDVVKGTPASAAALKVNGL